MFEFVSWLAASDHASLWFVSTSHAALGLSSVATYPERLHNPMVFLSYNEQAQCFTIHYWQSRGRPTCDEAVDSLQTPEVLQRIAGWVGVPAR